MREGWLGLRRWYADYRAPGEPLADFLRKPFPPFQSLLRDVDVVSLDIETTGLDPNSAEMLSVGWVMLRRGRIDLSSARTYLVRPSGEVGTSASVHGLTDTIVDAGLEAGVVLDKIVTALIGRALLVHHAGLDKQLLDRMCRQRYGAPLLVPHIDTLILEKRRQERKHHIGDRDSLRLGDLRKAYGLPRYAAHDCLVDAIATAELLMAMVAHNGGLNETRMRDVYV